MAIEEGAILGQDTTLSLETADISLSLINYDQYGAQFGYEVAPFRVAQSTSQGFTTPSKNVPVTTVAGKRGHAETAADLIQLFDSEKITNFAATDHPTYDYMVGEYGPPKITSMDFDQPYGEGTYKLTIMWGVVNHGYTPV